MYIEDIGQFYFNNSGVFHYIYLTLKYEDENPKINFNSLNIIGVNVDEFVFRENPNITDFNHWIYNYCDSQDLEKYKNIMGKNTKYLNFCINSYYDKEKKNNNKKK